MSMHRFSFLLLVALGIGMTGALGGPSTARAQDDATRIDTLFSIQLEDAELPPAPTFVRLLRITMKKGSSSPLHTHPGPEFWRIESGTVSVRSQGPAVLERSGGDPGPAPVNEEFTVERNDRITFLPGTPFTFTNKNDEDAKILAGVVLPAGHQRPPGITYVNGQPPADAFEGIESQILGDGLAETLPSGTTLITIERVRLAAGAPIPAEANPVLLSVARGGLDFTADAGCVQVSRTAEPGPQPCADTGTAFSLGRGDAAYFPSGMAETARPEQSGELTLYRLLISAVEAGATPVVTPAAPSTITVTGPIVEATAEPETTPEEATSTPEPEATGSPTAVSAAFTNGQTVYVNETDVRLRDAPTTDSNIVTGLTLGQALTITGDPVQADDIVWWPVVSPDDETFVGWVAEQFLSADPIE